MNLHSRHNTQNGFTLIEVLITSFILALISVGIYQATTSTFRLREQLKSDGDFYNGIRLAMGVIERDVLTLYNPVVILPETMPSPTPPSSSSSSESPRSYPESEFWSNEADALGVRQSRFVGKDSRMSMVSASHIRVYNEAAESDFAKVTYAIESDPRKAELLEGAPPGLSQLVRTESTRVFEGEAAKDPSLRNYILLRGIKKLIFKYYDKQKDRWEDSWDSTDEFKKGNFPTMVEVQLQIAGPNRLEYSGSYIFKPELPINGVPTTF